MFNPSSDLQFCFNDLGVVASYNGATTLGHLEITSFDLPAENGIGIITAQKKTFRYTTGALSGLTDNVNMVIAGTTYYVLKINLNNDGLETLLTLQG